MIKKLSNFNYLDDKSGVPYGTRTRVFTVKGWCPNH